MKNQSVSKILLVFIIFCVAVFSVCFSASVETYGNPVSNKQTTSTCDLFDFYEKYDGKKVTIKGVIDEEGAQGDWFYLVDGECRILIEVWEADFRVPQLVGKEVLVEGIVTVKMSIAGLLPTGVEVCSSDAE